MKPSGAHTHPEMGGSGIGAAAAVVLAAVVIAAVAGPLAAAIAELVRAVLIAAAALAALVLAAGGALVACRVRQRRTGRGTPVRAQGQVPWRAAEPLSAPRARAIEGPREVHLHFHGATAGEIAEVLRQLPREPGR